MSESSGVPSPITPISDPIGNATVSTWSCSTSTSPPPSLPSYCSEDDKCAVCGGYAPNRHFGARACNACAAFFRRTVARKHTYVCRRGKNCDVKTAAQRHICRYCRFQNCIRVGMDLSAVVVPSSPYAVGTSDRNDFLGRILAARRAIYVNRNRATIYVYGSHERVVVAANQFRNSRRMFHAICAEMIVVRDFLAQCALQQINEQPEWRKRFHYSWTLSENLITTVRNCGQQTGRYYHVDESYVTSNYDDLYGYYSSKPDIRCPDVSARSAIDFVKEAFATAERLREARLDDTEWAALFLIFTLGDVERYAGGRPLFRPYFEDLMCSLKRHYEHNYDDVAIRMGNLILLVSELNRIRRLFDDHLMIQQICGKISGYDRARSFLSGTIHCE